MSMTPLDRPKRGGERTVAITSLKPMFKTDFRQLTIFWQGVANMRKTYLLGSSAYDHDINKRRPAEKDLKRKATLVLYQPEARSGPQRRCTKRHGAGQPGDSSNSSSRRDCSR